MPTFERIVRAIATHPIYLVLAILATLLTLGMGVDWLFEKFGKWTPGLNWRFAFVVVASLVSTGAGFAVAKKFRANLLAIADDDSEQKFPAYLRQQILDQHPHETPPWERQRTKIDCPSCEASGNNWNRYTDPCHLCNSRAYIYTYRVGQPKCPPCNGTGYKNSRYLKDCPRCGGIGLLPYEYGDQG